MNLEDYYLKQFVMGNRKREQESISNAYFDMVHVNLIIHCVTEHEINITQE